MYHFVVFCLALLYSLTVQDAPSSPCVFSVPALESAISPRNFRAIFHKEIEFISLHKELECRQDKYRTKLNGEADES